jgi:ribonuclease VapC
MIIGSSAILAILSYEPEAALLTQAIEADSIRLMSAASLLETAIVIEARHGPTGSNKLDELISTGAIPFTRVI